ncbi:carbon starvation CstA family protein [Natrinema sp. DC36]|uniref:carbon starvation CstA family protein n=1 Tax=Natrinema sp. DC36 TaxID=2878680 RepID=UPI001CF07C6E|nr:carbon starvation CstA family protein [Natrinema sp. DC36]
MTKLLTVLGVTVVIFAIAYMVYGRFLHRSFDLDEDRTTPAHRHRDGMEYVPSPKAVLFGHHFSSIAGGAVIIGPITAALAWGWVPAVLWIVVGTVIFGGLNDFVTLVASIRHDGRSIGHIFNRYVGGDGKRMLLSIAVAANLLVIGVLSFMTAVIFDAFPSAATASVFYVVLAVLFGVYWKRLNLPFLVGSILFGAGVMAGVFLGLDHPLVLVSDGTRLPIPTVMNPNVSAWFLLILGYACVASVLPVWVLLQPRDYLSSFLLYAGLFGMLLAVVIGTIFGTATEPLTMNLQPFTGFMSDDFGGVGPLVPMLFPTIFCGAVCGLHSMVCCGTTPKQLSRETDAQAIGYGTTLFEGVLAVIAVGAIAVVPQIPTGTGLKLALPSFATGGGIILSAVGVPPGVGAAFLALMLSAFALTTVDTSIRLGRYFLDEITESTDGPTSSLLSRPVPSASLQTIAAYLLVASGSWNIVWPLFGGSVQIFASLSMFTLAVWLASSDRNRIRVAMLAGAAFVFAMSASALVYLTSSNVARLLDPAWVESTSPLSLVSTAVQILTVVSLLGLSAFIVHAGLRKMWGTRDAEVVDPADD